MKWDDIALGLYGDVLLDDSAFSKAISDFAELAVKIQSLRDDVEGLLEMLKKGFDTPAGRKFVNSCENNLLEPLDRQKLVIEHISSTLNDVKGEYSTVFTEYQSLNNTIRSYQ